MQNYKEELEKQIQEIDALITQIDKNALKVKNLSKCGIAISKSNAKNMIMTFETSQHPISSNIIKARIEEYLI